VIQTRSWDCLRLAINFRLDGCGIKLTTVSHGILNHIPCASVLQDKHTVLVINSKVCRKIDHGATQSCATAFLYCNSAHDAMTASLYKRILFMCLIFSMRAKGSSSLSSFLRSSKTGMSATRTPSSSRRRLATRRTPMTMMPEGPEVRILVDQLQGGVGMRLKDIRFLSGRYVQNATPTGFDAFVGTMTLSDT
jgi:hypothetical protein